MAKPGNSSNKKRYERYKQQGRREENKRKKAARHEKRMAKFAGRKEEGKGIWGRRREILGTQDNPTGTNLIDKEMEATWIPYPQDDNRLSYSRDTSIFARLEYRLNREALRIKAERERRDNTKKKTKKED